MKENNKNDLIHDSCIYFLFFKALLKTFRERARAIIIFGERIVKAQTHSRSLKT